MSFKSYVTFLFTMLSAAYAQQSPYSPRNGANAAAQVEREIKNPSVYLVIAIAPGFEDRASIANFRIGNGASVAVAYVTNGEDIPSDLNGEMFYQLASRRKEEAYHALSYLGAQSYFLNIPASEFLPGVDCFRPTAIVDAMVNSRLDSLIVQVKPDVIVLDRDPLLGSGKSARLVYLKHLIANNLGGPKRGPVWDIKRFFAQTNERENAVVIPVEQHDAVWSKSYDAMAHEAEKFYESLQHQIPLWNADCPHSYVQLFPAKPKLPMPLDKGLPEIGAQLKTLLPAIHSINSIGKLSTLKQKLGMIRTVIAKVDAFIPSHEQSMNRTDLRVLSTWKADLEKLRCRILNVAIPYSVSDTVVTPIQVFFLNFGKLDTAFRNGKTQILFPGVVQKQWIVNEAQNNFYPLKDSSLFRVLSPRSIALNSAESPQGFGAMQVRTSLDFIVTHQESDPDRNFMYKEDIPIIIAPFRSVEVLTPKVIMNRDPSICVRFRSNVRDKSRGVFYVNDPVVSSLQKKIELEGKNFTVIDTLPLIWKDTLLTAPREVKIESGQGSPVGSFIAQPIDVAVHVKKNVAVCSAIESSPLQIALRRLGVSTTLLDTTNFSGNVLLNNSVIIVDQFSFDKFLGLGKQLDSVGQWLSHGGRLIILPQYGTERLHQFLGNEINFVQLPVDDCKEKVYIDSTDMVFHLPNTIDGSSFTGERFALSYGEITGAMNDNSKVLMKGGTRVLILEKRLEQGRIFYCALNLFPRLLDIHKASYELLANLISTGLEK